MKKMIKFFATAAIAALALVSCNKEIEVSVVPAEGIQIAVVADNVLDGTKTALSGTKSIVWTAGTDKVGFFNNEADVNIESAAADVDGDGKATFTATVASDGTYYAYYPYQNETGANAPTTDGVVSRIPNNQYPTPTSFDPKADLLVSNAFAASGATDTPATIQFRRIGAFVRIQFTDGTTGSVLTGEHASSVAIQGEQNLSAKYRVHGVNGAVYQNSGYKKVSASYEADSFTLTASGQYAFFGIRPQTFANGSTIILTAETEGYTINKTLTMTKDVEVGAGDILPMRVNITDGDVTAKELQLKRVWSKLSTAETKWYSEITAGGAAFNADNQARSVAMDDEYIYLPKSSAYAAIIAVNLANTSEMLRLPTSGFDGTTFQTSFARVMKNTNPAVNSGKDILIVSNLSADNESKPFEIRAFNNGISEASTRLAAFIYDSANDLNDWRRYGDRFFVSGTYQSGSIVCPSYNASKTVILGITNGARSSVTQIWTSDKAEGIVDAAVYPGGSSILFSNSAYGIWATSNGGTNNGWTTYPAVSASAAQKTFGYNFFSYRGTSYIARVLLESSTKARLQIFEDSTGTEGGFLSAIAASPVFEAPLQSEDDFSANSPASSTHADCAVRTIGDAVYIAALMGNSGLSLFKLVFE